MDDARAEFKKLWIETLRSGKYQKGEQSYYNIATGCMCTLGLGASLFAPEFTHESIVNDGLTELYDIFPEINASNDSGEGLFTQITRLNDHGDGTWENPGTPYTFEQMADFLEENLNV